MCSSIVYAYVVCVAHKTAHKTDINFSLKTSSNV